MLSPTLSILALSATVVQAYTDTAPFFLYSTSSIDVPSIPQVATTLDVKNAISQLWKSCPTTNYMIALQSGASTTDYLAQDLSFLTSLSSSAASRTTIVQARDVFKGVDAQVVIGNLARSCGMASTEYDSSLLSLPELDNNRSYLLWTELPTLDSDLSASQKHIVLKNNLEFVADFVQKAFDGQDFTLVYITNPLSPTSTIESEEYQAMVPMEDLAHSGELRRSLAARKEQSGNSTLVDGPLFDRYQFLSPGIFMGGLVTLLLLSLLYVAVSALSSLQVTYAAFDKEQGQLSAKKQ